MAIPNNYIDKITDNDNGESRLICPAAEHVRVGNENFEGGTLDEVLDELAESIDEAASQGGIQQETDPTVPDWAKQPAKPTYTPQEVGAVPSQGYVEYTQAEKEKLGALPTASELDTELSEKANAADVYDKQTVDQKIAEAEIGGDVPQDVVIDANYVHTDNNYTSNDKSKLSNLPTAAQLDTLFGGKANVQDVVLKSRKINGMPLSSDVTIGIANIPGLVGILENFVRGPFNVSTNEDGTIVISVGTTDFTINLNHTHDGMVRLEKHTPSTIPDVDDMESDTIYAEVEDGEVSVLYIGGTPFYGGATSSPVLRQPLNGTTIKVGTIESGQSSIVKTITIKGRNLTQPLSVAVTGSGYSVNKQTISASNANEGTTLEITCVSTDDNADGVLSITSSEITCNCNLITNESIYKGLKGVKLTGTQWIKTPYKPNANTSISMRCRFIENANTIAGDDISKQNFYFFSAGEGNSNALFIFSAFKDSTNAYRILSIRPTPSDIGVLNLTQDILVDNSTIDITPNLLRFTPYGGNAVSVQIAAPVETANELEIGHAFTKDGEFIFNYFDLSVYELTISENGTNIHHFVPKLREGVAGLYDTITEAFITSQTSTALVAIPLT